MKFEFIQVNRTYVIKGYDKESGNQTIEQPFDSFSGEPFKTVEECKAYLSKMYPMNESQDETIDLPS